MAGHEQKALRRILALRTAQQAVAEMHVERLGAERRNLEDRAQHLAERRAGEGSAWAEAVGGAPFAVNLANAWAAALHLSQVDSEALAQLQRINETEVAGARVELGLTLSRAQAAEALLKADLRRAERRREEARLGELADRCAWSARAS